MSKVVAIHQPNFFPWLGYFEKIYRSDIFVYLDHTENNPRDPLFAKGVNIVAGRKKYTLTIPLERPKQQVCMPIMDMKISRSNFTRKHLLTIEQSYKKAEYFDEIFPIIKEFYNNDEPYIAKRNIKAIDTICKLLKIGTPKLRSSHYIWEKQSTDLLIEIVSRFEANKYLCGGGSSEYMEGHKFKESGFELIYQNFIHPEYKQINTSKFIHGLSIIDILMNCGFEETSKLLKHNDEPI